MMVGPKDTASPSPNTTTLCEEPGKHVPYTKERDACASRCLTHRLSPAVSACAPARMRRSAAPTAAGMRD